AGERRVVRSRIRRARARRRRGARRDRGGRARTARAGRGGHAHLRRRVPAPRARPLRSPRDPAGVRRGVQRLRSHGSHVGERTIARAVESLADLPGVERPRALGMIGAVDLEFEGAASSYLADAGWRVYEAARRRGVYLRPLGNVVYVAPPLNIPDADLAELL